MWQYNEARPHESQHTWQYNILGPWDSHTLLTTSVQLPGPRIVSPLHLTQYTSVTMSLHNPYLTLQIYHTHIDIDIGKYNQTQTAESRQGSIYKPKPTHSHELWIKPFIYDKNTHIFSWETADNSLVSLTIHHLLH